ncbi:MAG: hypothetical protein ACTH1D_06325 [Mycobacteriaceae bacterium]|uniref:hypothetical protein n=1 Tax=Corynebacterium variabile TaxID=1727 RepID=UPI002599A12C|nr:hypothetical protein [uncultured Corynebacterium sp.]
MSPARSPYPDQNNLVRDAFFGLPLPDGVLPDADPAADTGNGTRRLTDEATTCPDGLVEEVLWGLLHGMTAPVTASSTSATDTAETPEVRRA